MLDDAREGDAHGGVCGRRLGTLGEFRHELCHHIGDSFRSRRLRGGHAKPVTHQLALLQIDDPALYPGAADVDADQGGVLPDFSSFLANVVPFAGAG